jgi:hypothetical protein
MRYLGDFALFAFPLLGIVFGITLGREVTSKAHRNCAGSNLGKSGCHDNAGRIDSGEPGRQSKRHG